MDVYGYFFIIIILIGNFNLMYRVYQMTKLDSKSRGLKRPRLWGLFSAGTQNGAGLIFYFIERRKYPLVMSESEKKIMKRYKKIASICIIFQIVGMIGFLAVIIF